MRWPVALTFGLTLLAATSGCRSAGRMDRLESELRARETDLRETREQLDRTLAYTRALQTEVEALRGGTLTPGPGCIDIPTPAFPVRSITLGRQTGGYDTGGCPGDDALQIVLEPRDADNQPIKVPGALVVQALEVSPEGIKRPLTTWQVPPEQLRRSWKTGLFASGYQMVLPWKVWPSTEKLRVVAQLRLPDGRTFEADKDVSIRLTPVARRKQLPADPVPAEEPVLPAPRKLDADQVGDQTSHFPSRTAESAAPGIPWRKVTPPPAAEILRPVALPEPGS
jgi:hypothetical protein